MNKTILVTGGSGFVGKELIRKLLFMNYHVINIDIIPSGIENIIEFNCDLSADVIQDLPHLDVCVHLASGVGGILYNYKDNLIEYNTKINDNVFKICQDCNPVFIFISSLNVFECSNDILKLDPDSPYSASKCRGEVFFQERMTQCYVVRPPNLFGKSQIGEGDQPSRQSYGESHVIPDLIKKMSLAEDTIEVWGDGTQRRNFLHVSDLCDFLIHIFETLPEENIFNVRSNVTITISQLVSSLLKLFNKDDLSVIFNKFYMQYEKLHIDSILPSLRIIGKIMDIETGLNL